MNDSVILIIIRRPKMFVNVSDGLRASHVMPLLGAVEDKMKYEV